VPSGCRSRALDAGVPGLTLAAVAVRDEATAAAKLSSFRAPSPMVSLAGLAESDIVVECAPAALFERVAMPAIEEGRVCVPCSASTPCAPPPRAGSRA
jgi:aspartate dehydrogenase